MASLITTTVQNTVTRTVSAAASSSSAANRAPPQGGIIEHVNPSKYNPKDPLTLFIIQAGIIIIFCRLLHWPLAYIRQPRVIAEVIGGILLGPSVFGRIPGFTNAIFPQTAMPNLTLVANIGLVLFLFLVGLEVDVRFLVSNWRVALSVGLGGMALPFGLGCAIAWGLYKEFSNEPGTVHISFGVFMLFVGVAMAITAFPVLCRILTELKLLTTPVGVIVLSAGVGNDVTGWILLALCVALVNAGTGLSALWVLLVCAGYSLFLCYAVRPAFLWILRRSRTFQDGPSQAIIALTLLLTLASAFFTGIIGVHPIFGAFMVGIICPHEGGFAIKVAQKIEDLISALFLPLYFALSGLNTNIGLLDSGIIWGYVIGIIAVAFFGKFAGAAISAKLSGMLWREASSIGVLMSCKGLVELIVLNIGLNAKILSVKTFTMFVVMALVTTFATTPLTAWLYPPWYQKKVEAWKRGEIDWDGKKIEEDSQSSPAATVVNEKLDNAKVGKILVYLRFDNMPAILAFMSLFSDPRGAEVQVHPANRRDTDEAAEANNRLSSRPVRAHGVRLIGLTERTSTVMQVSEVDEFALQDPLVNTFRTFGQLYSIPTTGEVDVVPEGGFADALTKCASSEGSDLLFLPWSETGSLSEWDFGSGRDAVQDGDYAKFMISAIQSASCSAAIFVNHSLHKKKPKLFRNKSLQSVTSASGLRDNFKPTPILGDHSPHIFCPLFGGPDDLLALSLVMQMVEKGSTATIVRFVIPHDEEDDDFEVFKAHKTEGSSSAVLSTASPKADKSTVLTTSVSAADADRDTFLFERLKTTLSQDTLRRIVFETVVLSSAHSPVQATIERAASEVGLLPKNAGDMVVVGRNAGLKGLTRSEGDVERALGVVGAHLVRSEVKGGVLVVKSA